LSLPSTVGAAAVQPASVRRFLPNPELYEQDEEPWGFGPFSLPSAFGAAAVQPASVRRFLPNPE